VNWIVLAILAIALAGTALMVAGVGMLLGLPAAIILTGLFCFAACWRLQGSVNG